jgi:hypothetical protein
MSADRQSAEPAIRYSSFRVRRGAYARFHLPDFPQRSRLLDFFAIFAGFSV